MAKRGRVNMIVVREQMKKALTKAKIREISYRSAYKMFALKRALYIRLFKDHPVTQEIKRGPGARKNISGTLPGIYKGNLFSFIGFDEGSDPTAVVETAITTYCSLKKTPEYVVVRSRGKKLSFRVAYKMLYPSRDDLAEFAPMPWETGSWLKRIEHGMSGLGHYMFRSKSWLGLGKSALGTSKSGTAIQVRGQYQPKGSKFMPVSYISGITQAIFLKRG